MYQIAAPTAPAVSLDHAKAFMRVDGSLDDDQIKRHVASATRWVEQFTGRALINQTWCFPLPYFPRRSIELPHAPVSAITSVTYRDANGDDQTTTGFRLILDEDAPLLEPTGPWPATATSEDAVRIKYIAGYGADSDLIPEDLAEAIAVLAAYNYDFGRTGGEVPENVVTAVLPYRLGRALV